MRTLTKRLIAMAAVGLAAVGTAIAAMPPGVYEAQLEAAPIRLVAEVEEVTFRDEGGGLGRCEIAVRVSDVEKDFTGRIASGATLVATTPCLVRNPTAEIPVGGTIWSQPETLAQAERLELILNPDLSVAAQGDGIRILD
ncbi:MAG: hypothetical protein AAF321_03665 [Pseudomonadota bacterium]